MAFKNVSRNSCRKLTAESCCRRKTRHTQSFRVECLANTQWSFALTESLLYTGDLGIDRVQTNWQYRCVLIDPKHQCRIVINSRTRQSNKDGRRRLTCALDWAVLCMYGHVYKTHSTLSATLITLTGVTSTALIRDSSSKLSIQCPLSTGCLYPYQFHMQNSK
jgi:hypothetical protein